MPDNDNDEMGGRSLQLQATGLTLIGVVLGVAVTVAFGVGGELWLRVGSGLATFVVLLFVFRAAATPGHGRLARAAEWITRQ